MNWFKSFWKALTEAHQREAQVSMDSLDKDDRTRERPAVGAREVQFSMESLSNFTPRAQQVLNAEIEKQVGTGPDQKMIGNIPYTPRVKKVLALAAKEARALRHTYVGTEHIFLGLFRERDGGAARVWTGRGMN